MKLHVVGLLGALMILISACDTSDHAPAPGTEVIAKSKSYHDPKNEWNNQKMTLHLQEPRIRNPQRYSIVELDNGTGAFSLKRNRDKHIAEYWIDTDGSQGILLDGSDTFSSDLVERYRLDPTRNSGYRNFYHRLIGLPVSLDDEFVESTGDLEETVFDNKAAYKVPIKLKEALFSKDWNLFFDTESYEILGMEIINEEDPSHGERLFFDGEVSIGALKLPRMRHWHEYSDNNYSGSDIIVTAVDTID